jgi:hypothetical protein
LNFDTSISKGDENDENKRKRLQIPRIKGHVAKNSLFTTIAFIKDYEINIHENKDDIDLYFILWLRKGI